MRKSNPTQTPQPTPEPRLTLRKETLRDLSAPELRRSMGGRQWGWSVSDAECLQ